MYDFSPIDYPPAVELYVPKSFEGRGYDRIGARSVIGDVNHITGTNGRIEHLHSLMAIGGDRHDDLLVDVVIGRDGRIGLLNHPFDTEDPARAPWVNNGPATALSDAGAAFVSRFGTAGLGRYLVSKAHICRADQGLTDAQFEASARLSAAIHQQVCCPWDRYPYNPLYSVELSFWHCDFGAGTCPGDAFRRRWAQALEDRVRALLKQAQTGVREDAIPPVVDSSMSLDLRYPPGWTEEVAREYFGELRYCGHDGAVQTMLFDPSHVICGEWLCQGWLDGDWPEAVVWVRAETGNGEGQDVVVFRGGKRLVRYGDDQPWRWERLRDPLGADHGRENAHALGT